MDPTVVTDPATVETVKQAVAAAPAPSDFLQMMNDWTTLILVWVGFGTLVGLLAKAIMPGRDPGGAVATLAMGIGGTVIGCGTLSYFMSGHKVTPISPLGFLVATAGAFIILAFYRLLSGYFFVEGATGGQRRFTLRRRGRAVRRDGAHAEYEEV